MKKYQEQHSINESAAEKLLLDNLFNFFIAKYSDSSVEETERRFLISVGSLIDKGEISLKVVREYLEENGIEGEIPKPKPTPSVVQTPVYGDPCGRPVYRSSC